MNLFSFFILAIIYLQVEKLSSLWQINVMIQTVTYKKFLLIFCSSFSKAIHEINNDF